MALTGLAGRLGLVVGSVLFTLMLLELGCPRMVTSGSIPPSPAKMMRMLGCHPSHLIWNIAFIIPSIIGSVMSGAG